MDDEESERSISTSCSSVDDHMNTSSSSDDDDDDDVDSSCSSSGNGNNGSANKRKSHNDYCDDNNNNEEEEDYAAQEVRVWAQRVPIGLRLCPWAIQSDRQGRLKYITCNYDEPSLVTNLILAEAQILVGCDDDVPPLSSTLVVCPHVAAWNKDFKVFDDFVARFFSLAVRRRQQQQQSILLSKEEEEEEEKKKRSDNSLLLRQQQEKVTLVSFHPEFLRWRGLPTGIRVGSVVRSYRRGMGDGVGLHQKSRELYCATVVETETSFFGKRQIKVRYHSDGKERYVPTDWLVGDAASRCSSSSSSCTTAVEGPPLPDNAMHRAPYPTIHLIRNSDLGSLRARDVSRVKRKNAQQMMKLGWEGLVPKK